MGSQRRPQVAEAAGHRLCQMQVVSVDSRRRPRVAVVLCHRHCQMQVEAADGMSISLADFRLFEFGQHQRLTVAVL